MKSTTDSTALSRTVRSMLLPLVLVAGISSGSALANTVIISVAPPPARVEVVPVLHQGYVWAPGYWGWQHDKHVWVNGHTMRARRGYEWAPDHWTQVDNRHEFQPGRWTRGSELHGQ
jgi:hypothetical protein